MRQGKKKMMNQKKQFKCPDCGPIYTSHAVKWSEDLFSFLFPIQIKKKNLDRISQFLDWLFLKLKILQLSDDLENKKIFFRTKVFIEEAQKEGIKIQALKSKWGFINRFYLEINGKTLPFEGIPRAEFLHSKKSDKIDDKMFVKKALEKAGFPIAKGRSFWFWQKNKALKWSVKNLSFPLIVKPRTGSMSQHVTFNINSKEELVEAIKRANKYSPFFIIEEFLPAINVYRATVVDGKNVAVVRRIPAHIIGDGKKNIRELIAEKNQNPERGEACSPDCTTFQLIFNKDSERLLAEKKLTSEYIPTKDELVFIQEKVILDIGADLEEVTDRLHPDNHQLFCDVANLFDLKVAGIDFIARDISKSWKEQKCAVIELNSLPFVDMHYHPTQGTPVNVGKWLVDLVNKYYK